MGWNDHISFFKYEISRNIIEYKNLYKIIKKNEGYRMIEKINNRKNLFYQENKYPNIFSCFYSYNLHDLVIIFYLEYIEYHFFVDDL